MYVLCLRCTAAAVHEQQIPRNIIHRRRRMRVRNVKLATRLNLRFVLPASSAGYDWPLHEILCSGTRVFLVATFSKAKLYYFVLVRKRSSIYYYCRTEGWPRTRVRRSILRERESCLYQTRKRRFWKNLVEALSKTHCSTLAPLTVPEDTWFDFSTPYRTVSSRSRPMKKCRTRGPQYLTFSSHAVALPWYHPWHIMASPRHPRAWHWIP